MLKDTKYEMEALRIHEKRKISKFTWKIHGPV